MNWSGIRFAIGAFVLVIAGRVLGLPELVGCGIAGLLLCALAVAVVRVRRSPLVVERRVVPPQSVAGDWVAVHLEISNPSRRRSPSTVLADPITRQEVVDHAEDALVSVAPIAAHRSVEATYRIDTPRRGLITVGPMAIRREDPFGLATSTRAGPDPATVLVLPKVLTLAAPTGGRTDDPLGTATRTRRAVDNGEDFASLRAYVPGDDLRKVHWATSARRGSLMVRKNERPRQPRCTIVLDVRTGSYPDGAFELAVEAAASIAAAAIGHGDETRLVSTSGLDSLAGAGVGHLSFLLRELALVQPDPTGSLSRTVAALGSDDDTLVLVTSMTAAPPQIPARRRRRGTIIVPIDPGRDLASTWSEARLAAEWSR